MSVLTGACACPSNVLYLLETIHFRIGEVHSHAVLNLVFFICEGHNPLPSLLVIPCDRRVMGLASFVGGGPPTPFSNYDQELVGGEAHWELTFCLHSTRSGADVEGPRLRRFHARL